MVNALIEALAAHYLSLESEQSTHANSSSASTQPGNVASHDVHNDSFCNVICIVSGGERINILYGGSPIQRLSPENSAERAVVPFPDLDTISISWN